MTARPAFAFASLILTAGAVLLALLVLLAGTVNQNPLNQIFFLQADTSGIAGAPAISRWTYWNTCSVDPDSRNVCPSVHPAYPLDPPSGRNFGTTKGVPDPFIGTRKYFYLTRFMFAFALIALFFAACSLFTGLLALCSRIGAYLSGMLNMMALFFQTLTASLMTAAYVMGKNNFRANNQAANVGVKAFAFMWTAVACLFLSTALFCAGGAAGRKDSTYTKRTGGKSFFGRKKSTRSRGSFIDSESQRRVVKDEYS